jgi:hypothetical protein
MNNYYMAIMGRLPANGIMSIESDGTIVTVQHWQRAMKIKRFLENLKARKAKKTDAKIWEIGLTIEALNETERAITKLMSQKNTKAHTMRELGVSREAISKTERRIRYHLNRKNPYVLKSISEVDLSKTLARKHKIECSLLPYWRNHTQLEMKLA